MEHLVTAQPHFLVVDRSHPRPLDWYFLPHHYAVAALAAPPVGRPFRLPLAALTDQFPNFFLHHQIHQLQASLTNQFTHAFTQPAHHPARPLPRAASLLAALQFGMVSS